MKKDEIISMLQQQIAFLQRQLGEADDRLREANRKVDELLGKVSSLEDLLVRKNAEEQKQRSVIKGLAKIQRNKSERQAPATSAGKEEEKSAGPEPRERTNHGARRKEHCDVEVEEKDVYPEAPRFDRMRARLINTRDVVRYVLVPMRFIKKVYHVHVYTQDDTVMEGKAPVAPLLGSNYDGSFIAGIAQLRYIYSMPVERIVKYFTENGFDMDKATAHGLLRKTETVFENLYGAMGLAVKEDDYLAGDETYHRVLVEEKNKDGKGVKKGYVWSVTAIHLGLVHYFYDDGSRSGKVILNYIGDYGGTFQSDGFSPYRKMAARLTRLACLQHVKRKFLDCGDDFDAKVIVRLVNHLYHKDHQHEIGTDGWTREDHARWRREYAPPILGVIRKKLDRMAAYPPEEMLPKSEKYTAVHYMLNEWDAIENIFTRGDYHLDNNLVERLNRYISLSRRNSLFFGSHKGANRAAMFYSLACSCRLNNINFFEYISDVINRTALMQPNTRISEYRELLPDKWKARKAQ
ncbi:MAG: IS66 family transposase [Bacteroidaceae bacterium]|nr:IS66 family transposase [Bacteroidaceae bacterium]